MESNGNDKANFKLVNRNAELARDTQHELTTKCSLKHHLQSNRLTDKHIGCYRFNHANLQTLCSSVDAS
jgi:hypothetical protein